MDTSCRGCILYPDPHPFSCTLSQALWQTAWPHWAWVAPQGGAALSRSCVLLARALLSSMHYTRQAPAPIYASFCTKTAPVVTFALRGALLCCRQSFAGRWRDRCCCCCMHAINMIWDPNWHWHHSTPTAGWQLKLGLQQSQLPGPALAQSAEMG